MNARKGRGITADGRSKRGGQFVPISYAMAEHLAWRSLSGAAAKVYVELHRRFNGANNGHLSLGLEEAKRLLGLGKSTVDRALTELADHGFIVMTKRGHWYGRKASTWAVTDRPLGGALPTNAWQRWRRPENQNAVPLRDMKSADDPTSGPTTDVEPEICPATGPVRACGDQNMSRPRTTSTVSTREVAALAAEGLPASATAAHESVADPWQIPDFLDRRREAPSDTTSDSVASEQAAIR